MGLLDKLAGRWAALRWRLRLLSAPLQNADSQPNRRRGVPSPGGKGMVIGGKRRTQSRSAKEETGAAKNAPTAPDDDTQLIIVHECDAKVRFDARRVDAELRCPQCKQGLFPEYFTKLLARLKADDHFAATTRERKGKNLKSWEFLITDKQVSCARNYAEWLKRRGESVVSDGSAPEWLARPEEATNDLRKCFRGDDDEKLREIIQWVSSGAGLDWRSPNGWTLLHLAAQCGDPKMIRFLVDHGADVEVRDNTGETPLGLACDTRWGAWTPSPSTVEALLELGAAPDAANHDGERPLRSIRRSGLSEAEAIVALLEKAGAQLVPGDTAVCSECGAPDGWKMSGRHVRHQLDGRGTIVEFPCLDCGETVEAPLAEIDKARGVRMICPRCSGVTHIPPSVWCKTCGKSLSTGWHSQMIKSAITANDVYDRIERDRQG